MKFILTLLLMLALASPALAGPQSTIGGKRLETDMAHKVGTGWPSTFYEWWNRGSGWCRPGWPRLRRPTPNLTRSFTVRHATDDDTLGFATEISAG